MSAVTAGDRGVRHHYLLMDLERAHTIARERGPNMVVYWIVRAILQPASHVYFRLRRTGIDHIPREGPVLLAANHRSFSDPFFIGMCIGRPLRFVAKVELFDRGWKARLLLALGAFPIRRNESDEQAMETARVILEQGGAVGIFPEGTRVRPGPLGEPRRGVGRLALETGAPVVPIAVGGTQDIRDGWRVRPRRVDVRCGRLLTFPRPVDGAVSARMATEVTGRIWSCVSLQWEWLGGVVPARRAVVVGAGSWGTAVATLLARGGASVQLVARNAEQAARMREQRSNDRYLPGVELDESVEPLTLGEVRWPGADVLCLAVPSRDLPDALQRLESVVPAATGVVVLSKGLVAPDGRLPSSYILERLGRHPVACVGGPAHALEAVTQGASLTIAGADRLFCERLRSVFTAAGIACDVSSDIVGVQMAGVAKNAAALAAGAAIAQGPNAAGAAAGRVYSECARFARAYGAQRESFTGVAGAGDLVATVLASGSRNRRAGELLSEGVPAQEIATMLGQVPEAVDTVPALDAAARRAGVRAPAIAELAGLVTGRLEHERWVARAARATTNARAA
ncbi:MAG: 1-acyl-sn-glycerol-3-phosphate acyltransferase [Solirubrobacterales bacterium]